MSNAEDQQHTAETFRIIDSKTSAALSITPEKEPVDLEDESVI